MHKLLYTDLNSDETARLLLVVEKLPEASAYYTQLSGSYQVWIEFDKPINRAAFQAVAFWHGFVGRAFA